MMPAPKSAAPRRERVECLLTTDELARLDAARGHESASNYLLTRAGVRVAPAHSCVGCRHHPDYDCPDAGIRWVAERDFDTFDPLHWPPTAPACPAKEVQ